MPRKGVYPEFKKDKQPHPAAGLSIATFDAKGNRRPRASRAKPKKSELEQEQVQEFMSGMNQPPSMPTDNVYPPQPKSRQPVMGNPLRTYSNEKRALIEQMEGYNIETSFHPNYPQLTNYLGGDDIKFNQARLGYDTYDESGNIKPKIDYGEDDDDEELTDDEEDIDETTYYTKKEAILAEHYQIGEDDDFDYYIEKELYGEDEQYDDDYILKYPKDGYEDDDGIMLDSMVEDENPLDIPRVNKDGQSGNYNADSIYDRVNYYKSLEEGKVSHTRDNELMALISFMRVHGIPLSTNMSEIIEGYLDEELIGFGGYDISEVGRLVKIHAGIDPKYFDEESLTSEDFEYKQGKGRKPAKELRRNAYQKSYRRLVDYNIARSKDPDYVHYEGVDVKVRKTRKDKQVQPINTVSDYEIEQSLKKANNPIPDDEIEVEEIVIDGEVFYQDENGNVYTVPDDDGDSVIAGKDGVLSAEWHNRYEMDWLIPDN